MRLMRTALAVTSILALGLTACTTSDPGDADADEAEVAADGDAAAEEPGEPSDEVPEGDGELIYLVSKGFQHRFWQAVKEGAEEAGDEFNYKIQFVGPDDETKVTQQLDQLKSALDAQPIAIGLAALDTDAAEPVLQQIEDAEIPLVAFDSGVDSDLPVTTVQTDNYAAAEEAAQHAIELVGDEGIIGQVCHDQTSQTGKERCEGFAEYIEENAPGIEMVDPQYAHEVGLAANTAKAMIQANPEIDAIYGTNEASASGVVQGVDESGADVIVIGFDSGKTQLEAIEKGKMAGAVTQSPVKMGYQTVVAAIQAANGIEQPKIIDSGFAWYDESNMDDEEIAANLYE